MRGQDRARPGQDLLRRRPVVHARPGLSPHRQNLPQRQLQGLHLAGIRRQGKSPHRRAEESGAASKGVCMNEGEPVVARKSHRALRVVNILTLLGGVGLLALSIWPGFVIGCFLALAYPAIALLGLMWLFIVIRAVPKPHGRGMPIPPRQMLLAPTIVFITYASLT